MTLLSGLSISKAQMNSLFSMATISNFSLLTGTSPNKWKQAFVIPVFKEGDHQNTSNYRPTSVLHL